jgi:hypothetical protein
MLDFPGTPLPETRLVQKCEFTVADVAIAARAIVNRVQVIRAIAHGSFYLRRRSSNLASFIFGQAGSRIALIVSAGSRLIPRSYEPSSVNGVFSARAAGESGRKVDEHAA